MSLRSIETMVCPDCNISVEIERWQSLNVRQDPEKKADLFAGKLNRFDCPQCGSWGIVDFPFLYNDQDLHFMIFFISQGMPPDMDEIEEMPDFIKSLPQYEEVQRRLRKRVVRSLMELVEKVLIFEAGLDDRVIEGVKGLVVMSPACNFDDASRLSFREILPDGQLCFRDIGSEDGLAVTPSESYGLIERVLTDAGALVHNPKYQTIDQDFSRSHLGNFLTTLQAPKRSWLKSLFKR